MANLPQNYVQKLTDKNRKYWRLREILPTESKPIRISSDFILHDKKWMYAASVTPYFFSISVFFNETDISDQFNVRIGIFGESGENIVMSNAKTISTRWFVDINLMPSSQLHSIVESNELLIFFVEIEKEGEEAKQKRHKAKVFKRKFETDYEELLLSGKKSDLTINVKHRKFNCHSIILGARSPVFSAMMEYEMTEKRSGEVFIADTDPAIFQSFLLYIYTGKEDHLNRENITDLYKLGDKYCVEDLKFLCVEHMQTNMSVENFYEFFLISQQHSDSELSETAIQFFLENSEDIIENKKWTEFMKEYPNEAYVLVKAL